MRTHAHQFDTPSQLSALPNAAQAAASAGVCSCAPNRSGEEEEEKYRHHKVKGEMTDHVKCRIYLLVTHQLLQRFGHLPWAVVDYMTSGPTIHALAYRRIQGKTVSVCAHALNPKPTRVFGSSKLA
jgi:hypothetical protein